jgi:O-methyltransferase
MKKFFNKTFKLIQLGLQIITEKTGKYSLGLPQNYYTYAPWLEPEFQSLYRHVKNFTFVTPDRCYMVYKFSQYSSNITGDFAECGVYKGGTAYLIAHALENSSAQNKILNLFDTFTGMPTLAIQDPSGHQEGDFGNSSLSLVKQHLQPFHCLNFHPGIIPETFEAVRDKQFAFVHIDVDLYQTTIDCCEFFYERLSKGGIMLFDDYGFPRYKNSEKRAVDEFFKDKPEVPISLRTSQCLIIKL